ncbi:hypothetical protein BH09MYX1_BH09MYX1_34020 [soil metagenome]
MWSTSAFADKVAVLPFLPSADFVNRDQLEQVRTATKAAVTQRAHTLASDSELAAAVTAVQDGVADTSAEYRVAGKAATSQWTVVAHLAFRNGYWHLEVEVCLVATGRVESLTRDVDPRAGTQQIAEMLALLLRPEGIGNADVPWANQTLPPILPDKPPDPPKPPVPPVPPKPPEPPPVPAVKHDYAEKFPIAVGLGLGVNGAFVRPSGGAGLSTLAVYGLVSGEYAIDRVPGLALRGNFGGNLYGPSSIFVDVGARYAIPLVPTARLFFGPEVTIGALFPIGGDKSPRFLLRTDVFASLGIGERIQLEAVFDLMSAFGGDGPLVLGGGMLRGLVRF